MTGLFILLYIGWGFVRTVLIIIVVYYLFKIIGKIALNLFVNQAKANIRRQQQQADTRREGEVTITSNRNAGSKYDRSQGEYVDFEEID